MIRYNLHCERGHAFESWFADSAGYDSQRKRKLVTCPVCDSVKIEKSIMAPQIARRKGKDTLPAPVEAAAASSSGAAPTTPSATPQPPASAPGRSTPLMLAHERELRAKLKELRDHVVKHADNVGERFSDEARKMHYGDIEHRPIYGEASAEQARALIDEGIEVAPLPVLPDDRN